MNNIQELSYFDSIIDYSCDQEEEYQVDDEPDYSDSSDQ